MSDEIAQVEQGSLQAAVAPPPPPPGTQQQEKGDATGGIIPYKNVPALMAYYCGVFSLIPCLGLIIGLAALVLGIIGFRNYRRNPIVRGQVHAWIGIVVGTFSLAANMAGIVFLMTWA